MFSLLQLHQSFGLSHAAAAAAAAAVYQVTNFLHRSDKNASLCFRSCNSVVYYFCASENKNEYSAVYLHSVL